MSFAVFAAEEVDLDFLDRGEYGVWKIALAAIIQQTRGGRVERKIWTAVQVHRAGQYRGVQEAFGYRV